MGEPLCHPELGEFLELAEKYGFKVILTTNGTLLGERSQLLLSKDAVRKINISLHAFEANDLRIPFAQYLESCLDFGVAASRDSSKIVVYRLWNRGGEDKLNADILSAVEARFGKIDLEKYDKRRGLRLCERVFLEYGDKFDWPDLNAPDGGGELFCYGLRDQLGILSDGTVVPCCLDSEGDIALGNIFESELDVILSSKRATELYDGFSRRSAAEPLCRRCGYARRFKI